MEDNAHFGKLRTGILAYLVGRSHVYGLLRAPDGHTNVYRFLSLQDAVPLIDGMSAALNATCSEGVAETLFRKFMDEWGQSLLPPASALANLDILTIIPHSIIHGLPFHIVKVKGCSEPLGLYCGISYAPSATAAARCARRNPMRRAELGKWTFPLANGQPEFAPPAPAKCAALANDVIYGAHERYLQVAEEFAARFADYVLFFGDHARVTEDNRIASRATALD